MDRGNRGTPATKDTTPSGQDRHGILAAALARTYGRESRSLAANGRRSGRRSRTHSGAGRRLRPPGQGSRKRPATGWDSLTPTELQVVGLAAQGLTNPEIGKRLFIGSGTVKTHSAHIHARLDIRSRAELAAVAARRPG